MGRWRRWGWGICLLLVACREPGTVMTGDGGEKPPVSVSPPNSPPLPPPPPPPPPAWRIARPNPIPDENRRPGEPSWRGGRPSFAGQVEVYASTDSALAGETVAVRVSTSAASPVTGEVFRMGHYGGAGARRVWRGGPFQADLQPRCPRDPATARVECRWPDTFSFTVGADWVSGLYVVKVTRPDGFRGFAPLVVRDDRAAEVLYATALNTSQAYNTYGGASLYQDDSGTMPHARAREVSYDRPFTAEEGLGKGFGLEIALARFLEQHGYDVTYSTNLDFARVRHLLQGIGALVTGSHDEYWLREERDQIDEALARGDLSFAYFGANGGYWRVRAVPGSTGAPLRTMACYKGEPALDPIPYSTVRFRDEPGARPESLLYGVMYEGWQLVSFPLVVADPAHWLFEGTGVRSGDSFPGLLGNEYDRSFPGLMPAGLSLPMVSPVVSAEGVPSAAEAAARTMPSGRMVFAAGTLDWALALGDDPELRDGRVQRMTLNVLERALAHRRSPRALPDLSSIVPPQPDIDSRWARSVEAFAGVVGTAGAQDGPAASATFRGPTGLAVTPQGQVVVADTANNKVRLIEANPQRTVRTIAGTGELGLRDGPAAQSQLRRPTGVAVGPDGAVYVADSDNHCIRRIALVPGSGWMVSTYAGGQRIAGAADGPALTARFHRPTALAVDGAGHLFVADQANHRIRRIDAVTRAVTTVAGSGLGFQDALVGTDARFNNPSAIAVASSGELYVVDGGNQRLRRISADASRAVTTIAGDLVRAGSYRDGPGTQARFRAQLGLVFGDAGELLLADTGNFRLRKVLVGSNASSTQVFTIAGSGLSGTALGSGEAADLPAPTGVAQLPNGQLLVSDSFHHALRLITR